MKKIAIICLTVAISTVATVGIVQAGQVLGVGTVQVDSIQVGRQGIGGVTFFNGTIVNQTKADDGTENPVTFGDDVRIDGMIHRGEKSGPGDNKPVKVNDDMVVNGSLTVNGQSITAAIDYSSRFNTLDSAHSTINDNIISVNDDINTIITDVGTVNSNVGTVNGSVGNAILTTVNAHNNQVDIINNIAFHGVINCINTQYLSGADMDICVTPPYINNLVAQGASGNGAYNVSDNIDSPKIREYKEKAEQLKQFLNNL